jgi:nucleotide-sensitive chloride channel 1A
MASTNGTNVGAVQLIPSLPKYLSKDEHKEVLTSTPEDFSKIPPVLVYLAQDVSVTFTPPLEGFVVEETGTTKGSLHVISRYVWILANHR